MTHWLVDGNNVMGARPDGWWRDRAAAAIRLAEQVRSWAHTHPDPVTLFFDGAPVPILAAWPESAAFQVVFASRSGPDAADDDIVAWASRLPGEVRVVSSDRGLRARLPEAVAVEGAGGFLRRLMAPG